MAYLTTPRRRASDETIAGWLAISPWLVGFAIFTLGPVAASLYFSFTKYDVLSDPVWIGLANYRELLTDDPLFVKAIRNTVVYTLLYVPLHIVTALGVALGIEVDPTVVATGETRDRIDMGAHQGIGEHLGIERGADPSDLLAGMEIEVNLTKAQRCWWHNTLFLFDPRSTKALPV